MINRNEILDEYCEIHEKLIRLNDRIEKLKIDTYTKINNVSSYDEKIEVINNFKKQVNLIKTDSELKKKYSELIKRYQYLRELLVNPDNSLENNSDISDSNHSSYNTSHSTRKSLEDFDQTINFDSLEKNIFDLLQKYDKNKLENMEQNNFELKNNNINKNLFNHNIKELNNLKNLLKF